MKIGGIAVCGKCESVFAGTNLLDPCEECGGEMSVGMVDSEVVRLITDGHALEMSDSAMDVLRDDLYERGWDWDDDAEGLKRLREVNN